MSHFSSIRISIPLLFYVIFSAGISGDDLRKLSQDECGKLYDHQLKVHIEDSLLSPVISGQKASLQSDRSAQLNFCMKNINYANYKCQMDVKSVIAIHECHKMHGGPVDEKALAKADKNHTKKNKSDKNKIPELDKAISESPAKKVSSADCSNAYGRLLGIFQDSPQLKGNPDKGRMVQYWNSSEAKESFQNRCTRVFRPSDIECIMKGKNRDSLQACLLQIPAE